MFSCAICEDYSLYSLCSACRVVRHTCTLVGRERLLEVLENVFQRTEEKQNNKIKEEIKQEIENKEYTLRSKNKQIKRGADAN
tara:strand:- start:652 stop:900 length:249 start_codon:yes stop_codon:yes gene_type:complete